MDGEALAKLLGAGGFGGALLYVLYRVLTVVGERIVQALDRVVVRLDEHTAQDLKSHADTARELTGAIAEVRVDVADVRRELEGYAGEVRGVLQSWEPTPPPQEIATLVTPRGTPVVRSSTQPGTPPAMGRTPLRALPRRRRDDGGGEGGG